MWIKPTDRIVLIWLTIGWVAFAYFIGEIAHSTWVFLAIIAAGGLAVLTIRSARRRHRDSN